mmetsp:Transcript_16794/g.52135  ORF Transcript_16794/g.52135 Transcript_16794/m.52135 type:complete len:213 (-) Transcript_16794:13-651(-)
MAATVATARSPAGGAPQRPCPASISRNTPTGIIAAPVAKRSCSACTSRWTPSGQSQQIVSRGSVAMALASGGIAASAVASAATRASFAGWTISLEMKMSWTPPAAIASASPSFCTHTPMAPPSSISRRARAADLCSFACGRSSRLCFRAYSFIVAMLRSIASRSITSAGVSSCDTGVPTGFRTALPRLGVKKAAPLSDDMPFVPSGGARGLQ